jgi:hypothetical protein
MALPTPQVVHAVLIDGLYNFVGVLVSEIPKLNKDDQNVQIKRFPFFFFLKKKILATCRFLNGTTWR